MQKLNNKGFALAEILVVTVFVMIIFSIIYTNFYPIMAEYERRESYDDVDGKYAAYWFKKIIEKDVDLSNFETEVNNNGYWEFDCSFAATQKDLCDNLKTQFDVNYIYITKYETTEIKTKDSFSSGLMEYIKYLPKYDSVAGGHGSYRIIIEFHRKKDENDYYAYATMEVSK